MFNDDKVVSGLRLPSDRETLLLSHPNAATSMAVALNQEGLDPDEILDLMAEDLLSLRETDGVLWITASTGVKLWFDDEREVWTSAEESLPGA